MVDDGELQTPTPTPTPPTSVLSPMAFLQCGVCCWLAGVVLLTNLGCFFCKFLHHLDQLVAVYFGWDWWAWFNEIVMDHTCVFCEVHPMDTIKMCALRCVSVKTHMHTHAHTLRHDKLLQYQFSISLAKHSGHLESVTLLIPTSLRVDPASISQLSCFKGFKLNASTIQLLSKLLC